MKIDANGSLNTNIHDSSGNIISTYIPSTITNRTLYTHNVVDAAYNLITYTITNGSIISNIIDLNKYRNFDILIENISGTLYTSIYLYIYISKDGFNFIKTPYFITINPDDTAACILNCVINTRYIKLEGTYNNNQINNLVLSGIFIYMKG